MNTIVKILATIIIPIMIISCGSKPLSKFDFSEGDYKLYFFVYPTVPLLSEPSDIPHAFQEKHGNFYITDNKALEIIRGEIITDKVPENNSSSPLYIFSLVCNGKKVDGAILNLESNILYYTNGAYNFDLTKLERLQNCFNRLNSYKVNCVTLSNAKKFINYFGNSNGFIYYNTVDGENLIKDYNGIVELSLAVKQTDFSTDVEKRKKRFENDFKRIGNVKFYQSRYEGGDSMKVSMLWEKDFTTSLPSKYRIIKSYSDTIYFPLYVYDVEKKDLVDFFQKENITNYKIDELK